MYGAGVAQNLWILNQQNQTDFNQTDIFPQITPEEQAEIDLFLNQQKAREILYEAEKKRREEEQRKRDESELERLEEELESIENNIQK